MDNKAAGVVAGLTVLLGVAVLALGIGAGCELLPGGSSGERVRIVLELDRTQLPDTELSSSVDRTIQILQKRMREFGVRKANVVREGENRIVVEVPVRQGARPERIAQLIGQTARLEFRLVKQAVESRQVIEQLDSTLAARLPNLPDSVRAGCEGGANPLIDLLFDYPELSPSGGAMILEEAYPAALKLFSSIHVDSLLPSDTSIGFSTRPDIVGQGHPGRILYVMNRLPEITGEAISNAVMKLGLDGRRPGVPGVSVTMNPKGANLFRKATGANIGRNLAIVLDDRVLSAPVIRDRIPGGQAMITGAFSAEEASDLAVCLRAGAFPAPLRVIEAVPVRKATRGAR